MGLFRKKADPITQRARQLNEQIAALEAEIHKLSARPEPAPPTNGSHGSPFAAASPASLPETGPVPATTVPAAVPGAHPRLRSTALPHDRAMTPPLAAPTSTNPPPAPAPATTTPTQEPIFEELDHDRLQPPVEPSTPAHYNDLGVRKYDLSSAWQRFKNQFRGPVTSNPKLVHYLSAGSIQGLRPLRYEKRVARNRVIVLAAFLVLALWGMIAIFFSRR